MTKYNSLLSTSKNDMPLFQVGEFQILTGAVLCRNPKESQIRVKTCGEVCLENQMSRILFHRICSFEVSLSEYAPLIGGHVRLILVRVCDWLKRR